MIREWYKGRSLKGSLSRSRISRWRKSAAISVIDEVSPKNFLIGDQALLGLIINGQSQPNHGFILDLTS